MARCLHGSNSESFGAAKHTTQLLPLTASAEAITAGNVPDGGGSMLLCCLCSICADDSAIADWTNPYESNSSDCSACSNRFAAAAFASRLKFTNLSSACLSSSGRSLLLADGNCNSKMEHDTSG